MGELDHARDLGEARAIILAAARCGGLETTLAMLDRALVQIEEVSPPLDGDLWRVYSTVLAEATPDDPSATATVVPLSRKRAR